MGFDKATLWSLPLGLLIPVAIIIYMISTTHSVSTTDFNEKNAPTM